MTKPNMRELMPQTAAFIDELREVFGADSIDPSIRRGMAGVPGVFHAVENGHEIGTPCVVDPARVVTPIPVTDAPKVKR